MMQEMLDILIANPDVFVSENLSEDAESLSVSIDGLTIAHESV